MTDTPMHAYRTHNCAALRPADVGQEVRVSGWVHKKRDHGDLVFIDLRDHYGITQIVTDVSGPAFSAIERLKNESVVTITGIGHRARRGCGKPESRDGRHRGARDRGGGAVRGGRAADAGRGRSRISRGYPPPLPLPRPAPRAAACEHHAPLERHHVAQRNRMNGQGFTEFQTPILTASSPEGARDYLVPSRVHPGKFYALPQAPQMFKQLLMVAGFDRYFQIAPCFRDEDARADRSPGEFYQLDFEMSFVTQDDVFAAIEPVLHGVFEEFADWQDRGRTVSALPFKRIPYRESMLKYGNDKPDLRNPILITDVSDHFRGSGFGRFATIVEGGDVVRAIPAPATAEKSRKFFDDMNAWAQGEGFAGLGYATRKGGEWGGPIAKNHGETGMAAIAEALGLGPDDGVFFAAGKEAQATKLAGAARTRVGEQLGLIDQNRFEFCWIVDFPMFEYDEDAKKVDFSHNPFSMPQGELEALETKDPLDILAYQYDIVCNGIELSSGAIRNHRPDIMYKAFEIAGYTSEDVDTNFAGMINAFKCGAPPHGGSAPGIDRMVMLLAGEPNIREVVLFPMNQKAEDLMMGAPGPVSAKQLRELNIRVTVDGPKDAATLVAPAAG